MSRGAGRACKSSAADRKAGREKQRGPEMGVEEHGAQDIWLKAGRLLGSFAEGLLEVVISPDLTDSVQLQKD